MNEYHKEYTRENSLFTIQVWEDCQCKRLVEVLGANVPTSLFDARGGVVSVWYGPNFETWQALVEKKAKEDPARIIELMDLYAEQISKLEAVWKKGIFDTKEELVDFYSFMVEAWIGLSVSYCLPYLTELPQSLQDLGMSLRERSVDFLDNTDRVILRSLRAFYPELGDLVKYLTIAEIRSGSLPPLETLKERERHYIYFAFELITGIDDLDAFANSHGISLKREEIPAGLAEIKGQTAMKGVATGRVRVLMSKSMIPELEEGEVLVTAMTTPDYLPAMHKAAAFVTDEGGITCHAAIVARELKKPCIIGTKIATQALKTGDMVEVDANTGIVRKI